MSIGIISCQVMEAEVRHLIRHCPHITRLEIMPWGLHVEPDRLLGEIRQQIRCIENSVEAVMLGYGRCQALDRLGNDFKIPVFRPPGEDCIGVLLGQERYRQLLLENAGTWFLTPGWADLGMEFIFRELQLNAFAAKGKDPMAVARTALRDFNRTLLIDTGAGDLNRQRAQARQIAREFNWQVAETAGSLDELAHTLHRAVESTCRRRP